MLNMAKSLSRHCGLFQFVSFKWLRQRKEIVKNVKSAEKR